MSLTYPEAALDRDRWIVARRGSRNPVSPEKPYAFLVEDERFATGEVGAVATIFLTNRECPWRCAMCDLWRNTLTGAVPAGAIPRQIEYALARLPAARQIKLYNSGSFFDPGAIPPGDYPAIAALLSGFERVIVESHPSLVGERCLRFRALLGAPLEVAIGLETAHPDALAKLNKRMTPSQFARAADWLAAKEMSLRTFLLVHPPFVPAAETRAWMRYSLDFALRCRSTAIALIPTRMGNGAMEQLQVLGQSDAPSLAALECALAEGLTQAREAGASTRIFADLWDADRIAACPHCLPARVERLRTMNHSQEIASRVHCSACGGSA